MTRCIPYYEHEFALWSTLKRPTVTRKRRVLIGHQDQAIRHSLSLLVAMRGFDATPASNIDQIRTYVRIWKPDALLLDTRMDSASDHALVRRIRADDLTADLLILAMSNFWPLDPIPALRSAGLDGHVRRPCSLWRIVELVEQR